MPPLPAIAVLIVLLALLPAGAAAAAAPGDDAVILVLRGPAVSAKQSVQDQVAGERRIHSLQARVLGRLGLGRKSARLQHRYRYLPMLALRLDAAAQAQARGLPEVSAVLADGLYAPQLAQSTPLVRATDLWGRGYNGQGSMIAVLDTGVDSAHDFLGGRVLAEACFSSGDPLCPGGQPIETGPGSAGGCPPAMPGCAHGTHVAGTAAGFGLSFSGVARSATLMAIQVFSRFPASYCGGGSDCVLARDSDVIAALEYVYTQRSTWPLVAVNLSLGSGRHRRHCDDHPAAAAIELLRSAGILTVIATANAGQREQIAQPACVASAIAVAASNDVDQVAEFSNLALIADLLAPGEQIHSSIPGGDFADYSGTSMAAPHVAGAIALLRSARPMASPAQIEDALRWSGPRLRDQRSESIGIELPRLRIDTALALLDAPPPRILRVQPEELAPLAGERGGPFAIDGEPLRLRNAGTQPLDWSASESADWMGLSPAAGTLAPGQEVELQVVAEPAALALAEGSYFAVLDLRNASSGVGSTQRLLELQVRHPAPANDLFADAAVLAGAQAAVAGSNLGATTEPGEPAHGGSPARRSVWWQWTAEADGPVTLSTAGSDFDTTLAVYQGQDLATLQRRADNDDVGPGVVRHSEASFHAVAGQRYHVAVDGFDGLVGTVQLQLQGAQRPPGQVFASSFEGGQ